MVILPELVKILCRLPTLTRCSLPCRGATVLGPCSMARALHYDGSRFLNFCKTPLQAWEMSVWTQTSNFHQIWRNSTDGCPLWIAIARLPEVQLTWVLFLWLANAKLLIWGFSIFTKLHSRPEICAFENGLTKFVTFASIFFLFWRLPSLNGHSSARRGAMDPGPFSKALGLPADDFRHWKCLESPFQAWLIRVQSSDTIWYFWAIFCRTSSFYWFSLFSLPLSRFWMISFGLWIQI